MGGFWVIIGDYWR